MRIVYERAAGLDIHLKTVQACADLPCPEKGRRVEELAFATYCDGLHALADWLAGHRVQIVAMEATGVYWKPVWHVLEQRLPEVGRVLVNPRHVRTLPGRKTDASDAAWLAELAAHGLLRPSLVPDQGIRQLRDATRYRSKVITMRAAEANRIHKLLEDAGIKIGMVVSDIRGKSARNMIEALIAGERDVNVLAEMAMTRMRSKIPDLRRATTGHFGDHHAVLLRAQLDHIDHLGRLEDRLDAHIATLMAPFAEDCAHLVTVPGFGLRIIEVIIAETTGDMGCFPTAGHLASWACVCPGNRESAGKRKSGQTRDGNPYLRSALVEAARAAIRTSTYHSALYRHLLRNLGNNPIGKKKAALAVGHSLLIATWHILKSQTDYADLGPDYYTTRLDPQREAARLINKLEKLTGKKVSLHDTAA
jgi:transposase